ncbi:hypothetical protein A1WO_04324 [Escherichia coli KTE102]|nr:hypothetical protein A1WO_04324 [Escherichia coli KTE102]
MVVYPRWRGELNIGNGFAAAASGLSPLARGTRQNGLSSLVRLRFIPAGAGSSLRFFVRPGLVPVYPRWRGELGIARLIRRRPYGLSPLARGTPVFANLWTIAIRFIPAGAGNTPAPALCPVRRSVYPRWRGEHISRPGELSTRVGLSPLARGTL